ncbi:MAG: Lrp/AsnC family transcriptional regulator [Candidatus Anstonellales archaeon]
MPSDILDSFDRKIIYELDLNSRQPLSRLAKKLRMSPQRLDYRLKILEKKKIIIQYITIINYRKLGSYNYYVCNLRTFGMGVAEEDAILKKLALDPKCTLLFKCEGRWDIMIGTVAKDIFEAKETFRRFLEPFKGKIEEKAIVMHIGTYHYGRRYLIEDSYLDNKISFGSDANKDMYHVTGSSTNVVDYDELDIKILGVLSSNARMPTIEIAKRLKSNAETIAYRIRELEKEKVISYYSILMMPENYKYTFYRAYVKADRMTEEEELELADYLKRFQNIFRLIYLFGAYEFAMDLVMDNTERLRIIPSSLREHYKNSTMRFEPSNITMIYKFAYFPTYVFNPHFTV